MIQDEAKIIVHAGDGGDGLISFRHEKFVPRGGPDGGDGGKGGDVILEVDSHVHSLADYLRIKIFKAKAGEAGKTQKGTGKNADDLILKLPPGTMIFQIENNQKKYLADLTSENQKIIIVKGGHGGRGNSHFATAVKQTPRYAQPGFPGQEKELFLELKLIADIGLIGLPNAGKSTLLSRISHARPKIADYPFTTLEPNLGAVKIHDRQIIAADIPGLISGAANGKGLGIKFLRHIERTKIMIHLIDATCDDLESKYREIRKELEQWSKNLLNKKEIIVLNKIDAVPDYQSKHAKFIKKYHPLSISAVSGKGIGELLQKIFESI